MTLRRLILSRMCEHAKRGVQLTDLLQTTRSILLVCMSKRDLGEDRLDKITVHVGFSWNKYARRSARNVMLVTVETGIWLDCTVVVQWTETIISPFL